MKMLYFFLTFFIFLFSLSYGKIAAELELEKNKLYRFEELEAEIVLTNLEEKEANFLIKAEIVSDKYVNLNPQEFFLSLKPFEKRKMEIEWEDISSLEEGKYWLNVYIISENQTILLSKSFEILKEKIRLFSCLDKECKNQASIFYEGEKVCLNAEKLSNENASFYLIEENGEKEKIELPTCIENLKKGIYTFAAFLGNEKYAKNFTVIKQFKKQEKENQSYLILLILAITFPLVFLMIKRVKKGQVSFFVKTIFIVIASLLFFFLIFYYSSYQKSVAKEKELLEFKMNVLNLAQKLVSSEDCLSYKGEKGVIDKEKLDRFSMNYKEIEPKCAKEASFDYSVKVIQIEKKVDILPERKKIGNTLAWIPNSGYGNSVSLVSIDGTEIRRHWTVPTGIEGNPSRTAVDSKGNAWVGNRGTNTLVKIAFDESECIDKNNDGIIETSEDRNNDGKIDASEMLPFEKDECIVANVRLGSERGTKIRAVCIDANDNVYAGHWEDKKLFYVSSDGKVLKEWNLPASPYGCVVDKNNIVWISAPYLPGIIKLNPSTNSIETFRSNAMSYGIWVCEDASCVAFSTWTYGSIVKISSDLKKIWEYRNPSLLLGARGVFVDEEGNVYTVGSYTNKVVKLDKNGKLVKSMPTCSIPTGISMDADGNIWVICMDSGVRVYDKDLNVISDFSVGGAHYGYSDFTGHLTGAKLRGRKIVPIQTLDIKQKIWSFSLPFEEAGIKRFSPEKAKKAEITVSIPVTIRYNETFATEGIMQIYAVKGELEEIYGIIDTICERIEEFKEEIKFSKMFHFSYPVEFKNDKICMLDACKKIECNAKIEMKNFGEGDHLINFVYDPKERKITIS